MSSTAPAADRNAPLSLWRRAGVFLTELFNLFGEPQEFAARRVLDFKDYKLSLSWLRAGEALLRRFLLIEAALLEPAQQRTHAPPAHGPPAPSPASSPTANTEPDPDNPDSWRVSFRITIAERRLPGGTRGPRTLRQAQSDATLKFAPPQNGVTLSLSKGDACSDAGCTPALRNSAFETPRFRAAMPLARRFEALLRVYNNPAPFARRLAARLRKTAALSTRITKDAWETSRDLIGRDLYDAILAPFDEAIRVLADSS